MFFADTKRLTHEGARTMMSKAIEEARKAGIAISCCIVDAGGHVVILERMDGGRFHMGSSVEDGFIFDNEKWSHEIRVAPFAIASELVTAAEYLGFVEAGGPVPVRSGPPAQAEAPQPVPQEGPGAARPQPRPGEEAR